MGSLLRLLSMFKAQELTRCLKKTDFTDARGPGSSPSVGSNRSWRPDHAGPFPGLLLRAAQARMLNPGFFLKGQRSRPWLLDGNQKRDAAVASLQLVGTVATPLQPQRFRCNSPDSPRHP